MDRHPQHIKRERQDKKRRLRNITNLSKLRTHIKRVLETTSKSDAEKIYGKAVKVIDKAVSKNLIHKNTGARGLRAILENILLKTMYDLPSEENIEARAWFKDARFGLF